MVGSSQKPEMKKAPVHSSQQVLFDKTADEDINICCILSDAARLLSLQAMI